MGTKNFIHACGGIDWYCEQSGEGPHLVLVPSGEGDCSAFEKTAAALAGSFTVLTFDMPGFSRTSRPADDADISPYKLAAQIAALVTSLGIAPATFYGCSSGGIAVLDLVADHPEVVRNAIVHEVAGIVDIPPPIGAGPPPLAGLLALDDAGVVRACQHYFANVFNEDRAAWEALGPEYHARLALNYVTWVRQYITKVFPPRQRTVEELNRRPLAWTVGGLTPTAGFMSNIRMCYAAGITPQLLPSMHFPQVSIPDILAGHIRQSTAPFIA